MRLFGYYIFHTFVNQLKKLFKTWVLIFLLACMLIGGLVGAGASMLGDAGDDRNETTVTEGEDPEMIDDGSVAVEDFGMTEEEPAFRESSGIEPLEIVELAAGASILAVFIFMILSANKNGGKIFQPADVNLLFASPMQPQSVLLFRVIIKLGTGLLLSFYMLFQMPSLTMNLGISIWAALAAIAAWFIALATGMLMKILLYTVCSTKLKLKKYISKSVYAFLAILVGTYILYWKISGGTYLEAAVEFFNSPASRFIPLWGWIKGFCMYAMEGNILAALLCLCAIVISGIVLIYIIWHVKADFYEDAMAKSEETAALMEQVQSEKAGVSIVRRKKDRSEKLKRDGMRHGSGANVFFFKAMYNRFRFAHFGVFTKTAEIYLVAAVGVSVLCRYIFETDGLVPVVLTLAVFTFFRAMGNPLERDTQMDHFLLIPESTRSKLFWSLMGGTANCFLDLLPAMVVAVILLWANPLAAFAWIPLIVSVDFFATTVGAFIGISVPVSAGIMIKQIVQIIFIYFGMLPDVAVIAVGMVFDQLAVAAIGCAVLNVFWGLIFFFLTPLFLEPRGGKK